MHQDNSPPSPLRIAALIKQVPRAETMELLPDGRLNRADQELELNAYCRRAVAKGVELAGESGGECVVFTLGPASAEDSLREAIACGADRGVHITDPAFAGSDTLATARALAAALRREGPFDLILVGRNSVDADTGQVGPQLAQLLDRPFATGVRDLSVAGRDCTMALEHDDGGVEADVALPALLSVAERLCAPAKAPPERRAAVDGARITRLGAADLGAGPWGQAGSPTTVGEVRAQTVARAGRRLAGTPDEQAEAAARLLREQGVLEADDNDKAGARRVPPPLERANAKPVVVLAEDGRDDLTRELVGAAATLAQGIGARVVVIAEQVTDEDEIGRWGGDEILLFEKLDLEEDFASAVGDWARRVRPWGVLAPSTAWGREVAGRMAAILEAGLTGDAVDLEVEGDRLLAWKPAFGGSVVAAIRATSDIQMVTVRPGALAAPEPRESGRPDVTRLFVDGRDRVRVRRRWRDDDVDRLAKAEVVIGIGQGVAREDYEPLLLPLAERIGAEIAATRKVTDKGWQPRARQVGITGRSIAPRLYIAVGASGKFNHMVGVRNAGVVVAINPDEHAPVFDVSDIGIVADWREALPALVAAIEAAREGTGGRVAENA